MTPSHPFFSALGLAKHTPASVNALSQRTGIPIERLWYYNDHNILPTGGDLDAVCNAAAISEIELALRMGRISARLVELLQANAGEVAALLPPSLPAAADAGTPAVAFRTELGELYRGDCMSVLRKMEDASVDLIFADPPFNLSKLYPSGIDDNLKAGQYLAWCEDWLKECSRVLRHGGSLFVWNLPKWNSSVAGFLNGLLTFRHWIAVDIKYSLPISGRLYPSHYSLLYYVKGDKPKTFHPDRLPMPTCPKCHADLKDYGGYKDKMNPLGVNLADVWTDIPPVRHAKYKRRDGANELSLKLLDRIIEMASEKGDVVFDPFGGSGTTYMAAELKERRWVGCEIGPLEDIVNRFALIEREREILDRYRGQTNRLFVEDVRKRRVELGLWTCESFSEHGRPEQASLFADGSGVRPRTRRFGSATSGL